MKELNISQAELGIQKANAEAATYAAKAIAAKGKAEAEVLAAMYRAKAADKDVFLAETQRDIAQAMYRNMKDFKIEMPRTYIGGGGGGGGDGRGGTHGRLMSNLDVITGLSALGLAEKAGKFLGN